MNIRVKQHIKAPPLKIQGIKTKLVPFIMKNINWNGQGRWLEPFLGSGVVLFNVAPQQALVADTNEHIITFYRAVQNQTITPYNLRAFLEREGSRLKEQGDDYYYIVRGRFNEQHDPFDFLFLNRACFNGMMRFNSKGEFNVPFCKKRERFSPAYITKICNQVAWVNQQMAGKDWQFLVQDWRDTIAAARKEDFVYLDPPYNDRHTDYYNRWHANEADELAEAVKGIPGGFAYSTWKQNKYRTNEHLLTHFAEYPIVTRNHFYHVGPTESLRNAMEEALVIAPGYTAESYADSLEKQTAKQLTFAL
jgi:DNA adenine methylase